MIRLIAGMRNHSCFLLVLRAALVMWISVRVCNAQFAYDYYNISCPNVENTVRKAVLGVILTDPVAPAAFLRLLFHDCQVQGCDASIMLDSRDLEGSSEIASRKNFGIRKLQAIDEIKQKLEAECPGRVSCADIIALAAKVSVALTGGPDIRIPLGRKDSTTSTRVAADLKLPPGNITVDTLLDIFTPQGLTLEESVAIMGAHTLGGGHCINIVDRLFDRQPDDTITLGYRATLRLLCPTRKPLTNLTVVPNDKTPLAFDNRYYTDLLMGRGLFPIDSRMSIDQRTAPTVVQFAANQNRFFHVFSSAFVKLSSSNVLTNEEGEVRRICNQVNQES